MKIQYLSFAGISKTNGPAVNERGFIPLLHKLLGNNAHFPIPKPEDKILPNILKQAIILPKTQE